MKQTEIELILRAEKTIDQLKEVKAAIENNINATEDLQETGDKGFKSVGKSVGKLGKDVKAIGKGFKGASLASKGFIAGLGLNVYKKFLEILMQNQAVVNGLSIAFGTVSTVVSKVINAIIDAGSEFTSLGDIIKNSVMVPINLVKTAIFGIQTTLLRAQLAFEKSFLGGQDADKIKELQADIDRVDEKVGGAAKSLFYNFKGIADGVAQTASEFENFTEKAVEGIKEIDVLQELSNQTRIQDLRNETAIALAENDKLQFKYQLAAERQRQIRDDVTASIDDRIKANNKLGEVLQEQFDLQEKNAQKAIDLAKAEVAANPKSIEKKVALIEAEKNLLDVKENIAGFESEQRVNSEALEIEAIDLVNSKAEAENNRAIAKKRHVANEIQDELEKLKELKDIAEQEKELEETRLQNQINRLGVGTQARQDAEQQLADFQQQKKLEINDLDKKIKKEEEAREEALKNQKLQLAADTFGSIAQLLGENTKAGKAAGIAQALINSYLGFTQVLAAPSTLPEPFGSIQKAISAAGILASGLQTVKKIVSTKTPGGEAGSASASTSAPAPPQFNVVGASPENQLAEVLGDQQKQPVKAFVVSNEVSNAQALDRNIIEGASIG